MLNFTAIFLYGQAPIADFTVNSIVTCAGSSITFSDLSNYNGQPIIRTNWDFGDGGQSSSQNPSYTYVNAGTYQVILTVESSGGTDFEVKLDYIVVNPNPTVNFSIAGNSCSVPFDVTFNNLSSSGPDFQYAWDLGNGQTSTNLQPSMVTYNADGNYTANLIVTNTVTGCINDYSQTIVVSDYDAGINAVTGGCVNTAIQFNDASTVGANAWNWSTSDGQSSTSQNPNFTFGTIGSYTITLASQNTLSGCSSNTNHIVDIVNVPTPTFTSDIDGGCGSVSINFNNTSSDPLATYAWDFGNGATFSGENPPPQLYNVDGEFDVSLNMTVSGCTGNLTIADMVTVGPPFALYATDTTSGCAPLTVQFTDQSISADPSNPIVDWQWDFGDGTTFSGQNPPAHVFGIGTYDISLTVTTQSGCTNNYTSLRGVQVGIIDLVDFSLFPLDECAKTDITFTNLSVISGAHDPSEVAYLWDFGDGGTDTEENPIYNYPIDTGLFSIDLTVIFRGCEITSSKPDQIYIRAPIARFTSPVLFCNPTTFPITVNVTDDALSGVSTDDVTMIWRWGVPGDPDVVLNSGQIFDNDNGDTAHVYNTLGTFTIKQVIINNTTGCADSVENTLFITNVDASFILSTDTICTGLPLDLTSTSTFSHPNATYEYNMGEGSLVTGDPAQYVYSVPGFYDIDLIVTNAVGCADTATFPQFLVLENPVADFVSTDLTGCLPISVDYTNQSYTTGNGLVLSSFLWTFPDGTTQTTNSLATQTSFTFSAEGDFTTTLVATDVFGCVSPPTGVQMLITKPIAATIMDSVICDLDTINAMNNASGFGALTFDWYLDGVFSSNDVNILLSYDETASPSYTKVTHTVGFKVTDQNGCTDSISKNIHVSLPKANLSYVASGATANNLGEYTCPPVFETFTDLSTTYGNVTQWRWTFGDGTTSRFQNSSRTYPFPGTYTLGLTVTDEHGCAADTTLIDYLTILGPDGDLNWSIIGDPCVRTYEFTATNLTFVDSIVWNMGDGTIYYDSILITHTYAFGTYNATCKLIDSLGCEVTYPLDALTVSQVVLTADAGPDQDICQNSTNMSAVTPLFGAGNWSLISGSGTIVHQDSINSLITNLAYGTSVFEWRVTNACDTIRDTVEINYIENATISNAGIDQYICADNTFLEANEVFIGSGLWSLVGGTSTIIDPTDSLTQLTMIPFGINELVWAVTNFCSSTSDTVLIVHELNPTDPDAGSDQQLCLDNSLLEGNTPLSGVGVWRIINGTGNLVDSLSPTSAITALIIGEVELTWTIYNSCDTLIDTLIIERVNSGTMALAGEDQFTCLTTASLQGNEALIGTGNWNVISNTVIVDDPLDSLSTVSNLGVGENVLEWVITSFCGVTRDTVIINLETQPDLPIVGLDTVICQNFTTLNATPIIIGNGEWSLLSGTATITDITNPKSGITNVAVGDNIFQWKVSNSCAADSIEVMITRYEIPSIALAGDDLANCGSNFTLQGNLPLVGDGLWTVVSGNATFNDPTSPTTDVTNLNIGPNILQWEISNPCGTNPDLVTITIDTPPPTAYVGSEQTICGGTTLLSGSDPLSGEGEWTFSNGSGEINTISDSTSGVNELALGENRLIWTVSNSCSTSFAELTIINTGQCADEDSLNNELIFYVPNSFSPDTFDELNSVFLPVFTSGYEPLNFTLLIFNRWGELIFESYNADIGWKGTYGTKGRNAKEDVYTWKIIYTDKINQEEHTVLGHVILLR